MKYLLDVHIPIGTKELSSDEYLEATKIFPHNTPDSVLLEEARKRSLTVITADRLFVMYAVKNHQEIIYQDLAKGIRYLVRPEIIEMNCTLRSIDKKTKCVLRSDKVILP
jgi:hypothetical protein